MYLTDQLPKDDLGWRLITDPSLTKEKTYDKAKMHPSESTQVAMMEGFGLDGFADVADELVPEAVENLVKEIRV